MKTAIPLACFPGAAQEAARGCCAQRHSPQASNAAPAACPASGASAARRARPDGLPAARVPPRVPRPRRAEACLLRAAPAACARSLHAHTPSLRLRRGPRGKHAPANDAPPPRARAACAPRPRRPGCQARCDRERERMRQPGARRASARPPAGCTRAAALSVLLLSVPTARRAARRIAARLAVSPAPAPVAAAVLCADAPAGRHVAALRAANRRGVHEGGEVP